MIPDRRLAIQRVPISKIHRDPRNPRVHGKRNREAIASSLRLFGQVEPLVLQARTGRLIAGHGCLDILEEEGATEADVIEVDASDSEARALALALNRSGELAEWDDQLLGEAFAELSEEGIVLEDLGWGNWEIDPLLKAALEPLDERRSEDGSSRKGVRPVSLTVDQRERFERARDQLREWAGEEVTEGECVAQMADAFLAEPRAPVE